MTRTTLLRHQHDAAGDLVNQIQRASGGSGPLPDPELTNRLMAKLTGLLVIHFAQEDQSLYPFMERSGHGRASALAKQFRLEMGDLREIYEAFANRWRSRQSIVIDPEGFRRESSVVFGALARRIERENSQLYPLANEIALAGE